MPWREDLAGGAGRIGTKMDTNAFKSELIALLPKLRAHAIALAGSASAADDLIQDTMVRAWRKPRSACRSPRSSGRPWRCVPAAGPRRRAIRR